MAVQLPDWLKELRKSEVINRVDNDPRSVSGTLFGVPFDDARREVAGFGQAAFDEPCGDLSPDDRVLVYAYTNQLGHLEELVEAFRMLFQNTQPEEELIVVDLGCGPFTGGLALAGAFGDAPRFEYIGVDRSSAMCCLGERLATAAVERIGKSSRIEHRWYTDVSVVTWNRAPGWRPVFIIVSYLLASPVLDIAALIADLKTLLMKLGRGQVTILYTNSKRPDANQHYPAFSEALHEAGFNTVVDDRGMIEVERWAGMREREFQYALFRRPALSTLSLGGQ